MGFGSARSGTEGARRAEAKAFAHHALRLLWRPSFGNGDVASTDPVAVKVPQSSRGRLRCGHGDEGESARLIRDRIEH